MLIYEGDKSNYRGVNIKKNSDGTFNLSQSHLMEKIINHVVLELSMSLKAREMLSVKPLLHKDSWTIQVQHGL